MVDWWTLISKMNKWSLPPLTSTTRRWDCCMWRSSTTESDYGSYTQWLGMKYESVYAFPETTFSDSFYIDLIGSWFCKFVLIQGVGIAMALRKTTVDKTLVIKYKTQPKKKHREKKNSSPLLFCNYLENTSEKQWRNSFFHCCFSWNPFLYWFTSISDKESTVVFVLCLKFGLR